MSRPARAFIIDALVAELGEQGHNGGSRHNPDRLAAYPIKGNIDVIALADAVEIALLAATADDERDDTAKTPAELNAANDG
jgi:hypothetical protein